MAFLLLLDTCLLLKGGDYALLTVCRPQNSFTNNIVTEDDIESHYTSLAFYSYANFLVIWALRCGHMKIESHVLIALSAHALLWLFVHYLLSFFSFHLGCNLSQSELIFKVLTTTWGVPPDHILTNLIINWLLDANADRKLGNLMNSEQMKTPKPDCLLKFKKAMKFITLEFQVCRPWKIWDSLPP